jgi:hypothetical protein
MLKFLFLLLPLWSTAQITSYTAAQTGVGNADVYWPEGATHAVVFVPGKGEMGSNKELLYKYNSPINWVRSGERPSYAVIAIQPTAYNSNTYLTITKFVNWIYKTFPIKTYSPTGLSYGAAAWYDYIKKATDYKAPYSAVLMSITSEAQCDSYRRLCGTDTNFRHIKLWAMAARNESHHDKQKKYTDLMITAGYPAKWTSGPNKPGDGHCCWEQEYSQRAVKEWLSGPTSPAEPPLWINAGRDTTILFPQDSFILRPTIVAPIGAELRPMIIEGSGVLDGMILKNIYKSKTTVRIHIFYDGKQAYDDITITAAYDPEAEFFRFKVLGMTISVTVSGKGMQVF